MATRFMLFAILGIFSFCSGCNSGKTANVSVKDILERLQSDIATIESIIIATEETDPNNKLNKQGEYIELGWFIDSRIEKNEFNDGLGVHVGGGIEKFRNEDDAQKREKLLDSVIGTPFSPGYHERLGVFIIRISNDLTASQQNELAEKIKKSIK